jgi:hypothetical protein
VSDKYLVIAINTFYSLRKFDAINEIENQLPTKISTIEWELMEL